MKTKILLLSIVCVLSRLTLVGQEAKYSQIDSLSARTAALEGIIKELRYLKISGYIQAQAQWGQEAATLRVGSNTSRTSDNTRIGMRRSRVKFSYERGIASAVFQIDATERAVGLKDAYIHVRSPWTALGRSGLRLGVFDRPFGHEISYSSSLRESPERSAIFNNLFPDERDLGAMLVLQASKKSPIHFLRLEGGLFAGNAISPEQDSRRDFIGHLSASNSIGKDIHWGLGVSRYYGYRQQNTSKVYRMEAGKFVLSDLSDNLGAYATRRYWGIDAQLSLGSAIGRTELRAEYLWGQQPSAANSFRSHNVSTLVSGDTYIRPFRGGYALLTQQIGKTPLSLVLKYDWLDPNTAVQGEDIGLDNTTSADAAHSAIGMGLLWNINSNLRLQAYYEMPSNETSSKLKGYEAERKDDNFTLRLQYKF